MACTKNVVNPQRKTRTVKNGYVDIDSITSDSGENYTNWFKLTKEKLKERDRNLLSVKISEIERIVNQKLTVSDANYSSGFKISQALIDSALKYLHHIIDHEWKGINISKTKKEINTFRSYFHLSKNWWYSRKKKLNGSVIWLRIFQYIQSHIDSITTLTHDSMLFMRIMKALLDGTVQYANTKPLPLINHATVIDSKELQRYLVTLHPLLDVHQIMRKQECCARTASNRGIAPLVMHQIRLRLSCIIKNNTNAVIRSVPDVNVPQQWQPVTDSWVPVHTVNTVPILTAPQPIPNCNILSNGYIGNHAATYIYTVQNLRSSPLLVSRPINNISIVYPHNNTTIVQDGINCFAAVPVFVVPINSQMNWM